MMRFALPTSRDRGAHVEEQRLPLLTLSCLLAITVALLVVDLRLGSRLAMITAGFAAVSLTTRIPRVVVLTACLCLVVAAIAVLDLPTVASAAHAVSHSRRGR